MLHHNFVPGPTPQPVRGAVPDRTSVLDPKDFWPKGDCPDWPNLGPNQGYDGQRGKAGAEARLETIGLYLNRGASTLRAPTDDERLSEFDRTFKRIGSNWHSLGIYNLAPKGMMTENDAGMMVEACHIRAYLKRLEAKAVADVAAEVERKKTEARRTLEEYRTSAPEEIAAIQALNEAVARHKQREEDERAVSRRYGLVQQLNERHFAAVGAAHTLGLSAPNAPQILD